MLPNTLLIKIGADKNIRYDENRIFKNRAAIQVAFFKIVHVKKIILVVHFQKLHALPIKVLTQGCKYTYFLILVLVKHTGVSTIKVLFKSDLLVLHV